MGTIERFLSLIEPPASPGACALWRGNIGTGGYGRFYLSQNQERIASRIRWAIEHGPIAPGMLVLHRCDNPRCVNLDHLWLGTQRDNVYDMLAKGRGVTKRPPAAPINATIVNAEMFHNLGKE